MLITFRDWNFSYFIAFLSRLSAWAELWKLRNRKMGVLLKRGRMARVERFRKLKREKKALLISQVLLWGWLERTRNGELRGAGLAGQWGRKMLCAVRGETCRWSEGRCGEWGWVDSADWTYRGEERNSIIECQVAWKELSVWEVIFNRERPVFTSLHSFNTHLLLHRRDWALSQGVPLAPHQHTEQGPGEHSTPGGRTAFHGRPGLSCGLSAPTQWTWA